MPFPPPALPKPRLISEIRNGGARTTPETARASLAQVGLPTGTTCGLTEPTRSRSVRRCALISAARITSDASTRKVRWTAPISARENTAQFSGLVSTQINPCATPSAVSARIPRDVTVVARRGMAKSAVSSPRKACATKPVSRLRKTARRRT